MRGETQNPFSFTRVALSTNGREKKRIPVSRVQALAFDAEHPAGNLQNEFTGDKRTG
jgi:hypothetical protein